MKQQTGFGAIAAIVVLVIMAALAAAITSLGSTQHVTSAQDVLSARAWQAARAGNEWGLFQALQPGGTWNTTPCPAPPAAASNQTIDLTTDTGFHVTVLCHSWLYNEGESTPGTARTVRIYRITSVACPAATCPATDASVTGLGYVERTRVVLATN